jgi:hypothetical protein
VGNGNVLRTGTVGEVQAQMGRQLVIIIIGAGFGSLIYFQWPKDKHDH